MNVITFIKGAAIGAGMMYLFDPSQGRRRRARIRDGAVRAWNDTGDTIEAKTRDLSNRAQGVIHDAAAMLAPDRLLRQGENLVPASWAPSRWSPTTRMVVTAAAGLLALYGKRKGGVIGTALGAVSVGIVTNSVSASDLRRGFAVGSSPALPSDLVDGDTESSAGFRSLPSEHTPRGARS